MICSITGCTCRLVPYSYLHLVAFVFLTQIEPHHTARLWSLHYIQRFHQNCGVFHFVSCSCTTGSTDHMCDAASGGTGSRRAVLQVHVLYAPRARPPSVTISYVVHATKLNYCFLQAYLLYNKHPSNVKVLVPCGTRTVLRLCRFVA